MSRIGKMPIKVPSDVTVEIKNGVITAKKGNIENSVKFPNNIKLEQQGDEIIIKRLDDERLNRSCHGTYRSLISNLISGLTTPFKKVLEIQGVGYRANVQGENLVLQMGFSHDVIIKIPDGIKVEVEKNTILTITGHDKFTVGEFAANIRKIRKPEPYKGKGIRYEDEIVRRKAGKTAK